VSRDDETEDEAESSAADRQREPERVIDADADVAVDPAEGATADAETDESDAETDDVDAETSDVDPAGGTTADTETDEGDDDTDPVVADVASGTDESSSDAEGTETQTEQADADGTGEPAMRSGGGLLLGYGGWTLLMLSLQILATVGLVGLTAQSLPVVGGPLVPPGIPSYVYVYAAVGAVGYTFTRAVTVDVTTERLGDWTIRIFAALPLAAATYLLVTIAVAGGVGGGEELTQPQLALVALLTGLFVNTSYARLDAAADRLLGPSR